MTPDFKWLVKSGDETDKLIKIVWFCKFTGKYEWILQRQGKQATFSLVFSVAYTE